MVVASDRGRSQPVSKPHRSQQVDGLAGTVRHIGRDAQAVSSDGQVDTRREDGRGGFGDLRDRIVETATATGTTTAAAGRATGATTIATIGATTAAVIVAVPARPL